MSDFALPRVARKRRRKLEQPFRKGLMVTALTLGTWALVAAFAYGLWALLA